MVNLLEGPCRGEVVGGGRWEGGGSSFEKDCYREKTNGAETPKKWKAKIECVNRRRQILDPGRKLSRCDRNRNENDAEEAVRIATKMSKNAQIKKKILRGATKNDGIMAP